MESYKKFFRGTIDLRNKNIFGGWVTTFGESCKVVIIQNNTEISSVTPTINRTDLEGRHDMPLGFTIEMPSNVSADEIISGSVRFMCKIKDCMYTLKIWDPVFNALKFDSVDFGKIETWKRFTHANSHKITTFNNTPHRGFQSESNDKSISMGKNGFLFLKSGTNNAAEIYLDSHKVDIQAWTKIIESRSQFCAKQGVQFLQIMIPEKSSVLFEYCPFSSQNGSKAYTSLTNSLKSLNIPHLDLLQALTFHLQSKPTFLITDSHLSTFGAAICTKEILNALNCPEILAEKTYQLIERTGDLGARYFLSDNKEELEERIIEFKVKDKPMNPKVIDSHDPEHGHIGIKRVFLNENAPIQKRVVCFGNSFFERGGASSGLSWWLARHFAEFHFIWSPLLDKEYINDTKPHIVLCQTIERFLVRTPEV